MTSSTNGNGNSSGGGSGAKPTDVTYTALQTAYDTFNRELFGGRLPACMITLRTFGKARGYFSPNRFVHLTEVTTTHEIALDPRQFIDRSAVEILSTLAHEMCHLEQTENGTPSRNGYHNRQWGQYMTRIGLVPSATGEPGGKQTGQAMTHYIETGGAFETVATALLDSGQCTIGWADIEGFLLTSPNGNGGPSSPMAVAVAVKAKKAKKASKSGRRRKYVCPTCTAAVWGRPGLVIGCLGTEDTNHDPAVMA